MSFFEVLNAVKMAEGSLDGLGLPVGALESVVSMMKAAKRFGSEINAARRHREGY